VELLEIKEFRHEGGLRYWFYRGQSDRLVICFSGIGTGFRKPQPYEFAKVATMNGRDNVLFLADTDRSWLNNPGMLEAIKAETERRIAENGIRTTMTLGHSMGGYCAIVLAGLLPVDCCVAYAPQFSVNPDVIPNETRWRELRGRIREHRIRSVEDYLSPKTRYYVFHGDQRREARQRDRFVPTQQLLHIILPGMGHSVPQALRSAEVLEIVTQACFEGRWRLMARKLEPFNPIYLKPKPGLVAKAG
jgi:hypothetical protein